jgi:predicted nucleotidyltransferase
MTRADILNVLATIKKDRGDELGLLGLGVFGSVARNDFQPDSDLDIVVRTRTADPFPLVHLKAELESRLKRHVDIVRIWAGMNPELRSRIDEEAVYV